MTDFTALFSQWPYLVWAFSAAAGFYAVTRFAVSHLNPDRKAHLSLWLQGDYDSTWAREFGAMFDRIFGERHLRLRCFALSAAASLLAVLGLWALFDPVLGVLSVRADAGLALTQALLLGAAINIIPDYLSLYETRWLLKTFEKVRHPLKQLAVLALDAVVTGAIIFIGIRIYLWASGQPALSLVEMAALFSFYAVFFYSTFLTSVWAWAYCLSSWIARGSRRLKLPEWLDIHNAPGAALALVGAALVFAGALVAKPALTMDEDGRVAFDGLLCDVFPADACTHVARLTKDEEQQLQYLAQACLGGVDEECMGTAFNLHQVKPEQAARLWAKACAGGDAIGCYNLGQMYRQAIGVEQDEARAASLYRQACDGGDADGCANLGFMYANARGVERDDARAVSLYRQGCDGGNAGGCTRLGFMYGNARGVERDDARAVSLYRQGCDGGEADGCTNLGVMYANALGVEQDYDRAVSLYRQGCDGGDTDGCTSLGFMYAQALGVERHYARARSYYYQGCDGGSAGGCYNLGVMHHVGDGVEADLDRARLFYQRACDLGEDQGCAWRDRLTETLED